MLRNLLFALSPLVRIRVVGDSMQPNIPSGEWILVRKIWVFPKVGDVVLLKHPLHGKMLLKRIVQHTQKKYFVQGDNKSHSTDSRDFGWINKNQIIGVALVKKIKIT